MSVNNLFGSDNHAGVHPAILAAIAAANRGPAVAYGADSHTAHAIEKFKEHFGANIDVYFVFSNFIVCIIFIIKESCKIH